jgi:hypothetical protein
MQPTFRVWAKRDDEAQAWYTAKSTVAGLKTSGSTLEELRERLLLLVPDFLEDEMPPRAILRLTAECKDEPTAVAAE